MLCFDLLILFFFFKQKTAYEMRISDWSSDVCSSDLRIHERLAMWVRMDDGDLRTELQALGLDLDLIGYDRGVPALMQRARSLFATVIDSPGGAVRVQTIHSFCQTLLASFPLEARILPGFRALADGEAEIGSATCRERVWPDM